MKTYARINSASAVAEIITTDADLNTLYHPALVWQDITDCAERPKLGDICTDGLFSTPAPTYGREDSLPKAAQQFLLARWAQERMAPLQDAVDLGIATAEETAALAAWKAYRVALNRLDISEGEVTDWPVPPVSEP